MSTPTISVALSVFNAERFLDEAISSVLAQSFGDFEFLILDDGSSDASRAIIEDHARRDSRIRAIIRENRGLIASLNQLIEESRAGLIARMDGDDICHPERFARQVAFLADHPDHGVVGCWTADIDENGQPYRIGGQDHPVTHEAFLEAIERNGPLLCHPGVMYRRDVVRAVGGYHAAFRHCEDLDLWLRLASVRIANIPERLLTYRHYAGQVSNRHLTEQQIGAAVARLAYMERQGGRPDPTEHLDRLPALCEIGALFGAEDAPRTARSQIARSLLHSRSALAGEGFDILLHHVREGGSGHDLWRTAARLLTFGEPVKALRLACALAKVS
jgi:glycosyltransferase involved in cell wall biosynthesis